MAKDRVVDLDTKYFKAGGFYALNDTTAAPIASMRVMRNAQITDRGGIAPRLGTILIGDTNTSTGVIRGFYNFRKSLGSEEILIKTYDTYIEFMSKNYESAGWTQLKNNLTSGAEFGFVTSLVNTDNSDYVAGSNRYESYFTWTGAIAQLTTTLAGGEVVVTVDSTLLIDVYHSTTATSSSSTTLDVSSAPWAASQWVNFYVRITSGTYTGYVRKISANTTTQITFAALPGDPGLCTFEIRKPAFPDSGTLIYNNTTTAYTAINTDTTFTVASASAGASGILVTIKPTDYPANPRGNRLANYLSRIAVGNVRSALARDSGGALQGWSSAGSVFVSKLNNPADFSFSATRSAGEGDLINMPYGGGNITDVVTQEDTFYSFKGRYIEATQYSQDSNDLAVRTPLKAGFGSIGRTVKGVDDIYFFTPDKQITSIGRVKLRDTRPQNVNIGNRINQFLKESGIDADVGRGAEISGKIYFPIKYSPESTYNDIVLVYNKNAESFEGIWDIGAFAIEQWNDKFVYAESNGPDVYEMFVGHADVRGTSRFPIEFEVISHKINLTASKSNIQAMSGILVEGYVAGGATFTTKLYSGFESDPFFSADFAFTESGFLDGESTQAYLGSKPFAIDPNGAVYSDPLEDGRRHFSFRIYFPFQYSNYFSFGLSSNDTDDDFEVTRLGLIIKESPTVNMNLIKYI